MRKVDPNMAIPYWDWSYDAEEPLKSPIFSEEYLYYKNGPNGDCRLRCTYPTNHCLTRNYQTRGFTTFVNSASLILLFNKSTSFDSFRQMLEATPHAIVHAALGGEGGDLTTMISPNDPIFFLHHSFIDKIWWDFQLQTGRFSEYNGFHSWMPVFSWNTMEPFGKTVTQSFNLTELCVEYVPFSKRLAVNEGKFMHKFKPSTPPIKLPHPIPESFISMTGLSTSQFREIEAEINEIIQEANGVNPSDKRITSENNCHRLSRNYWSIVVLLVFFIIIII